MELSGVCRPYCKYKQNQLFCRAAHRDMILPSFVVFTTIQVMAGIMLLCVIMLLFLRKLKKQIEIKDGQLLTFKRSIDLAKQKIRNLQDRKPSTTSYSKHLKLQMVATNEYFQSVGGEDDLAQLMSLPEEAPLLQRVALLRYQLLVAEKEAFQEESPNEPLWTVFEIKIGELLSSLEHDTSAAEINTEEYEELKVELQRMQQKVKELENFESLVTEIEQQWKTAQQEANQYYQQLSVMADEVQDRETFEELLENYQKSYNEVENTILLSNFEEEDEGFDAMLSGGGQAEAKQTDDTVHDEIKRLQDLTSDQHKVIARLQEEIKQAASVEEKEAMIDELCEQFEKQKRFAQESATCIELLENELNVANDENKKLQKEIWSLQDKVSSLQ